MGDTYVVVDNGQREPIHIGFFGVLLAAAAVGVIIKFFWLIFIIAVLAGFGLMLWRAEMQQRRHDHRLGTRADYQNRQFLEGDPRGIYGDGDEGSQR